MLRGCLVFITGGTNGIGFAVAQAFLNTGAQVVITERSDDRIRKALDVLSNPTMARGYVLDNAAVNTFETTFHDILGGQIDILIM